MLFGKYFRLQTEVLVCKLSSQGTHFDWRFIRNRNLSLWYHYEDHVCLIRSKQINFSMTSIFNLAKNCLCKGWRFPMSIKPCCLDQGYIQAFHNHSTYYSHLINRKKRERERRKQGYSCGNLTQHKEQDLISIFFLFVQMEKYLKKPLFHY